MELQLGLTLSTNPSKLLDLNSRAHDPFNHKHNKRTFSQLLDHAAEDVMLPTLSLLPLTPSLPNNDDQHYPSHCSNITENDEEGVEALVGWPPVNYWRKKLRVDNCDDEAVGNNDRMVWIDDHHRYDHGSLGIGGSSNTLYVKVKMEGVGIARKVDLSMHQSFQALKETLMDMFGKCHQLSNSYELAYQDKEGDWLLAEDVPWRSFVQCARRLKLLKSSG